MAIVSTNGVSPFAAALLGATATSRRRSSANQSSSSGGSQMGPGALAGWNVGLPRGVGPRAGAGGPGVGSASA